MTTIVRGHNFGPTDIVNPADLNDLIKNAVISGLSLSDIPGSGTQISTLSAPSGAAVGWISAQYDKFSAGVGTSIYSEFNYVLSSVHGPVSLFKPTGMESRRFWSGLNSTNLGPGRTFGCNGQAGVTLVGDPWSAGDGWLTHRALGANHGTSSSGTRIRLVIRGHGDTRHIDSAVPGKRKYLHISNNFGQFVWNAGGTTDTNKVYAISMRPDLSGDVIVPSFFFGAPLWRS